MSEVVIPCGLMVAFAWVMGLITGWLSRKTWRE